MIKIKNNFHPNKAPKAETARLPLRPCRGGDVGFHHAMARKTCKVVNTLVQFWAELKATCWLGAQATE